MMKIDLLAIVAHPDDAELCCSGTLMKHANFGYTIGIIDLTQGELGSRGSAVLRRKEAAKASTIMGLSARENIDLGDGTFQNTHENRLKIIQQIRRYQPEIIITNAPFDRHPDHGRAGKLVAEACFYSGLVKIETTFNDEKQQAWRPKQLWHMLQDYYHEPSIVIDISDYWDKKMEAVRAFSSQFYSGDTADAVDTPISGKGFFDFLKARAVEMGRSIGVDYAEGFVKSRIFGVENLFMLE